MLSESKCNIQGNGEGAKIAKLSKSPKDVWSLWKEYEFGLHGQKPARDFTAVERGANKYNYSRRKVLWDTLLYLINKRGYTAENAITRVYRVYGAASSVTHILNLMVRDRQMNINRFA